MSSQSDLAATEDPRKKETFILIASVFIAGLCSLIYELLISTTSSYFLGDSIKQFSLTIGFYMAAMGIGSYLSRLISDTHLIEKFVGMEIVLGLLGGISVPVLYLAFTFTDSYSLFMFGFTIIIGILIGLEIPLLTRIMERYYALKFNISNVLSVDYFGALVATLAFPFFLLPLFGTFKSSLAFGLINMSIGFINLWCFADQMKVQRRKLLLYYNTTVAILLIVLLFLSNTLLQRWNNAAYADRVIYSQQSSYQSIVMTRDKEDIRLFLNGNLQFSSIDEYRYHELLVHLPVIFSKNIDNILILGGGDGLAVRELLHYDEIKSIKIIDLDPAVTQLARTNPHVKKLNQDSLLNPKVEVIHQDAFVYLKTEEQQYDIILVDLPDPSTASLARLYSKRFYQFVRRHLRPEGVFITQATSPFYAKPVFWSIHKTVTAAGFKNVLPIHANVPSFGEWGYVLATDNAQLQQQREIPAHSRYLSQDLLPKLMHFAKDLRAGNVEVNTLDRPIILQYYLSSWRYWN